MVLLVGNLVGLLAGRLNLSQCWAKSGPIDARKSLQAETTLILGGVSLNQLLTGHTLSRCANWKPQGVLALVVVHGAIDFSKPLVIFISI